MVKFLKELIVNKENLLFNIKEIKKRITKSNYTIIAVVKGNGYGLGIVPYTKFLSENGINFFGISSIEEAINLRDSGINENLIILTPFIDKSEVEILIKNNIILTIDSYESAKIANAIAKEQNKTILAHIKIDTGLSRYGFTYSSTNEIYTIIKECNNIIFEGIFSHLSNSLAKDNSWSILQFNRFTKITNELKNLGIKFKYEHICNSSGFFKYPNMHLNCARIGSAFLGSAYGSGNFLKHIGTFHTKISRIKQLSKGDIIGYGNSYIVNKSTKIAIIHTGYFDGIGITLEDQRFKFLSKAKRVFIDFKKLFSNNFIYLKINGKLYKVLGQIRNV